LIYSRILCKQIKNKRVDRAKKLLKDLIDETRDLDGRYYTKTSQKFLEILESGIANAKQKNLAAEKLFVRNARADKGENVYRPRTKWNLRGRQAKSTNIEVVLEER
jgi:ribosomal protein L22